jgi:hypothetical protein
MEVTRREPRWADWNDDGTDNSQISPQVGSGCEVLVLLVFVCCWDQAGGMFGLLLWQQRGGGSTQCRHPCCASAVCYGSHAARTAVGCMNVDGTDNSQISPQVRC